MSELDNGEAKAKGNNGNGNGNGNHSHLRMLREKKGMSQRALARKTGIEQSRLSRLEAKAWKDIDLGNATLLTQGLGCDLEELIPAHTRNKKPGSISFGSIKKPLFTIDYQKEVQVGSLLKPDASRFIGVLTLAPLKRMMAGQTPCASFLLYFVHRGSLALICNGQEREFKEGQTVVLNKNDVYALHNQDPVRELILLLISIPSFIHFNS